MYGGATFLPEPMTWPGVSPPEAHYGSKFYNPQKTAEGQARLDNFLSEFSRVFDFTSSSQYTEVVARTEEELRIDHASSPFAGVNREGYEEIFSNSGASADELVAAMLAVRDAKRGLSVLHGQLGNGLENWDPNLKDAGSYDSQVLFPLIETFNGANFSVSASVIGQINAAIGRLNRRGLIELGGRLGVGISIENDDDQDEARATLRNAVEDLAADASAAFPRFDEASVSARENSVSGKAITPAIGMVGANIVGKSIAQNQEISYKMMERRQKEIEIEKKRAQSAGEAKSRAMRREALAKGVEKNASVKNQGRKKA